MKRRIICILLVLSLSIAMLPIVVSLTSAEDNTGKTPGTVDHIADGDTMDSYRDLIALRDESRRAGRVWADKSVFTGNVELNLEWDGYAGENNVIYNNSDFLHVFSTLGSSQVVDTKENIPLDVVFILDFSYSMGNGLIEGQENTRLFKTLDAVNNAINTLLFDISADSRVGIAVYSNTATQFVPLINFVSESGNKDTKWLTVDDFSWSYGDSTIRINGKARKAEKNNEDKIEWTDIADISTYCTPTVKTGNSTNLQAGIAAGMGMLATEEVTQWKSPKSGEVYNRIPITIIMTDGGSNTLCISNDENDTNQSKAWYDTNFTERWNSYADDKDEEYIAPVALPTLLTAAYYTVRITSNYGQKPYSYGVAVDITPGDVQEPKIQITLDPGTYFNDRATGEIKRAYGYYEQWLARTSEEPLYIGQLRDGYTGDDRKNIYISQLPKGNSPSKEDVIANLNYTTKELIQINSTDMDNVFTGIIKDISDEKGKVFIPVGGNNDVGVEDALSYIDPIGKYMEVKTIKNVLLFGNLYDVIEDGDELYYDQDNNPATKDDYAYSIQNYKISEDALVVNPCYGENSGITFNLSDIEIYVKNTGDFHDTSGDEGGMLSGTDGDQTLYINIPAKALPMQVATILVDDYGNAISYDTNVGDDIDIEKHPELRDEYIEKKAQSSPIRVFYEVGIANEIKTANNNIDLTKVSPDYVTANRSKNDREDDGKVYFYSNFYNKERPPYNDYVTETGSYTFGDPVLTFSPSNDNRYYIFDNARLLFENPHNDKVGGIMNVAEDKVYLNGEELEPVRGEVQSDKWYYVMIDYYDRDGLVRHALPRLGSEFGSGIGGTEEGASKDAYLCWYDPINDKESDYMKNGVVQDRPAGYYAAAKKGGLRVGDMSAGIGIKGEDINNSSENNTDTSSTYYLPSVSSSTTGESADDIVINLYLGNNGRLAVTNTQLLVTKTVETSEEFRDVFSNTAFEYTIKLKGNDNAEQNGIYNAIKATREEGGTWRALIETIELLTNNKGLLMDSDGYPATVSLNTDKTINKEGTDYYVYVGGVSSEDNFTHTLFDSKTGASFHGILGTGKELTVEVAYLIPVDDYGDDWNFTGGKGLEEIEDFPVGRVEFDEGTQIGFAVKTDYQSKSAYQKQALRFEDGEANFKLKDGEGLLFIGLDSATEYTVTEKLTDEQIKAGVLLKSVTHIENDTDNKPKETTYYGNSSSEDKSHRFDVENHTYSVSGETTATMTEEVNYTNYPPKAVKEQVTPKGGLVSVGDEIEYVIYWENNSTDDKGNYISADITITDPLDKGVDFVKAEFVEKKTVKDGENTTTTYEPMTDVPSDWECSYDDTSHTVTWTIKDAQKQTFGFVRLTIEVNENAPFALDENRNIQNDLDNIVSNKAHIKINNEPEFSTNTAETPVEGVHKTEVSVASPNDVTTDVGAGFGNLNHDTETGHFVGPMVDKDWNITYNISFANYQTDEAKITVTDRLDPDVDFVSAKYKDVELNSDSTEIEQDDVAIAYDSETRAVSWTIDNVAAGVRDEVSLTVKVNSSAFGEEDQGATGGGTQTPDPWSEIPEGPKDFELYPVQNKDVLEPGVYVIVNGSNKKAVNNTLTNSNFGPVEITGNTITGLTDTTLMWIVEHSDDGSSFSLGNVYEKKYLNGAQAYNGALSLVTDKADATQWTIVSNKQNSLGFKENDSFFLGWTMIGLQITYSTWNPQDPMTFYKLKVSEPDVQEPELDMSDENPEGISGDYMIINRASVKVGNDAKQITETIRNPLTGVLIVEKQVIGTENDDDKTKEFEFTITLTMPDGDFDPQKLDITGDIDWEKDGDTGTGSFNLISGQSVTIGRIPYNTSYTVKESEDEDFILRYITVNENNVGNSHQGVSGNIDVGKTQMIFYNAPRTYNPEVELPETGGKGTNLYYILGGLLTIGALPWLIIKKRKSRRVSA